MPDTPINDPVALLDRLPDDVPVEAWMLTEGAKAAPLWILTAFGRRDFRIWGNVLPNYIEFDLILGEEGWSGSERALLRAAANLGGYPNVPVDLAELAASLDDERWDALLSGLRIRRAKLRGE